MVDVWLIRHAESESNRGLPTTDPASIAVTTRGYGQAEHIARAIPVQPTLLVVSPYLRTQQTAQPTIARFPLAPRQVWAVQEFTYLAQFRGMRTTPAQRRQAVEAYWRRNDPSYRDGDGAESFVEFATRVQSMLERLRQSVDGFAVVFSHEQFIRATLWSLLSATPTVSPERMQGFHDLRLWLKIPNAAIARIRFDEAKNAWLGSPATAHLPPDLVT